MSSRRPRRRTDELLIRRVDDELVVHDLRSDRISKVDDLATQVWDLADGRRSIDQIVDGVNADRRRVEDALACLDDAELLDASGIDRRDLLAKLGVVAVAAPVVSIMAPSAAAASSPGVPVVGGFSHSCRGSHTSEFRVTIGGFPANTLIQLFSSWSDTRRARDPLDPTRNSARSDGNGVATFTWSFFDTGQPIRSRTVRLESYQVAGVPPTVQFPAPKPSYTGSCP